MKWMSKFVSMADIITDLAELCAHVVWVESESILGKCIVYEQLSIGSKWIARLSLSSEMMHLLYSY